MASACTFALALSLVAIFFVETTYRLGRDPVIMQLASDLAWFLYSDIPGPLVVECKFIF